MPQVAPQPIQLPQHERVAGLQSFEAGLQAGPGVVPAGGEVLVDAPRFDAGLNHRVALRGERLATVALGDADVADEHGRGTTKKDGCQGAT